jgi:adenylate cyclase class 2
MPERQEIEIKFSLRDPAAMRSQLLALGAAYFGRHVEMNLRLDDEAHSLTGRGIVLRLRSSVWDDGDTRHLLTVKTPGPRPQPGEGITTRREIEVDLDDADAMITALEVLGYTPAWRYEKRRETFRLDETEIVIDELPFGWFMEIEGEMHDIQRICAALGLDLANGLPLSYAEIFANVQRNLALDTKDLTFEAFADINVPATAYTTPMPDTDTL